MKTKKNGKALILGLTSLAAIAGAGILGYKYFNNRQGEAAIRFLPASSFAVITLDTNPSERQALTFKKINDAMKEHGLTEQMDGWLDSMMQGDKVATELRSHLGKSFGAAMWSEGSEMKGAMLLSVSDGGTVQKLLDEKGPKEKGVYMRVLEDYLVICDSQNTFAKIEATGKGELANVASLKPYAEARAGLPEDANLMAFVNYDEIGKVENLKQSFGSMKASGFGAFGLTIEPDGLAFDMFGNVSDTQGFMKKFAEGSRPLNMGRVESLPEGSFGFLAIENPGSWGEYMQSVLEADKSGLNMKEGIDKFEKETGINFQEDLVKALSGTVSFGVYPGSSKRPEDLEIILSVDGEADASKRLAGKVRDLISKQNPEVKWEQERVGDSVLWEASGDLGLPKESAFLGKTMCFLETPEGIVFGSSTTILNRTQLAFSGSDSLKSDPMMTGALAQSSGENAGLFVVNLARIMKAMEPTLADSAKQQGIALDDMLGVFGSEDTPMTISWKPMEGNKSTGRMFVPINYDKLFKIIGATTKRKGDPTVNIQELK